MHAFSVFHKITSYIKTVSSANNRLKCLLVRVGAIWPGGTLFFSYVGLDTEFTVYSKKISGKSSTPKNI